MVSPRRGGCDPCGPCHDEAHEESNDQNRITHSRGGEVYLVAFDPAAGHEIPKTRPALVIRNNVSNRHSPITIVAAFSSRFANPPHPRKVVVSLLGK